MEDNKKPKTGLQAHVRRDQETNERGKSNQPENKASGIAKGDDLGTAGENTSGQVGRAITGSTELHKDKDENTRATNKPGRAITGSTAAHRASAGIDNPEASDANRLGGAEDSRSFDRNEDIDNR